MGGLKPTFLWLLFSLAVATFAHPDHGLQSLRLNNIEKRELDTFSLHKRCVGSCSECFGAGYQECASSSSICFKPGDPQHGEETCSSSGTADSTVPTAPIIDYCAQGDCEACFGAGSTECPGSTSQCYIPGDSKSGIESCSSSSGSDSSGTTPSSSSDSPAPSTGSDSSSISGSNITTTDFCDDGSLDCKRCFGSTFIPCADAPDSYCYDPNNSTSICPDGTSPGGSSGSSSGSGSVAGFGSSTYTASTPPTGNTASPTQSSAAIGTNNAGTNAIGSTTSPESGNSRTSAAAGSGHISASSGNSNGNPANATTNGQPCGAEGMFGVQAVLALCFTALVGVFM
ncbi:hypothetical protein MBLNU13_g10614t1 [Cladosporium sp. NU13]